ARRYVGPEAWTCYEINPTHVAVLRDMGMRVHAENFLDADPRGDYDAVVMNPPFARGQDIAHVTHAFRHQAPGGRLVAVVSQGTMTRRTKQARAFHELVDAHGWWEPVPDGAFAESGTMARTAIVVLDREGG